MKAKYNRCWCLSFRCARKCWMGLSFTRAIITLSFHPLQLAPLQVFNGGISLIWTQMMEARAVSAPSASAQPWLPFPVYLLVCMWVYRDARTRALGRSPARPMRIIWRSFFCITGKEWNWVQCFLWISVNACYNVHLVSTNVIAHFL